MKYYLASSFADKEFAQQFVRLLDAKHPHRYENVARWVFDAADEEGLVGDELPPNAKKFALKDLEDVARSQALVLLIGDKDSPGKNFEAGFAMGRSIPIYPVGDRKPRTIFRELLQPQVSVHEFLARPFGGDF